MISIFISFNFNLISTRDKKNLPQPMAVILQVRAYMKQFTDKNHNALYKTKQNKTKQNKNAIITVNNSNHSLHKIRIC